ncbi:MAG TPA: isoleucine--tRNA ligase [Candidatus Sulfotelmatobacter sp.]|jgi:isoleucyl-tRNA synthetase|nr:isoleucine--tRNA ligase [Candidatus Sulfotelmatobacter sp.]
MAEPLELKKTLNLPKTDFPMKAGLPLNEPKQLAAWQDANLYEAILSARKGKPLFVLHDGPPYPTGTIHLGTGLNKILKDLIVKTKSMAGHYAPYVPGWDCHGLPIETQVEKELGGKGRVPPAEFRRLCREFATRYVEQHKRDFKRLGVFGRWNDPYLTMSHEYEATIANAFLDFIEKGYVYRGRKPVYWCIYDSTALAEAEVEYEDHNSPSIWVKFPVVGDGSGEAAKIGADVSAVIWTTTPWTIPHNRALAFHPDFEYVVIETEKGKLLLAADRVAALQADCEIKQVRVLAKLKGHHFEGMKFQHPFLPIQVPGVLAGYVTLDQGSGIVHTAPGHGVDDFNTGQKYNLETVAPLDDRGVYTEGLPEYKGKDVFTANPIIVKLLSAHGALLGHHPYKHSYPHCWRCHNPVIFRATEQWFIKMDETGKGESKTFRQEALDEIHKVKWIPAWGEDRMYEMIEHRPDWCVSRQRFWGTPIIVFYCEGCGKRLEDFKALRNVIEWFKKEGADAWYKHSAEELLPAGTKCSCSESKWRKENDILDVWFDSGSSHLAVLKGDEWPADVYLEGPDQYRGWFHSSLLIAVGVKDRAPYKGVVTHGWTLDEQGRPMSKSLGNSIEPNEICEKWGADLLRLWVASVEYQADVKMSERVMTQLSEAYRKIRNTFRFALGNLNDFDPSRNSVANDQLEEMDRWMLERTADLVKKCREWYANYEFHRVYHAIHDYCVVDLSAFYYDVLKDRLYTKAPNNLARRSAQTAVYKISSALVRLATPILVFTSEEIWKYLPKAAGDASSVHISLFPEEAELRAGIAPALVNTWELLAKVRGEVLKALETARNDKKINSGLEAKVLLGADLELKAKLKAHLAQLPGLFIVSQVDFLSAGVGEYKSDVVPSLSVTIQKADGKKCDRCWNYSTHVGENPRYPTICERCSAALAEIESSIAASA